MADNTKIQWTDASWNPIRARNNATGKVGWHCVHKSAGCAGCYAEGFNMRLGTGLPFKPASERDVTIFLDDRMLTQPLRWRRSRMIFVCSMTDLFADFVSDDMIDKVFAVMALAPAHTFQVLTKREDRMLEYCSHPMTAFRIAKAKAAITGAPNGPEEVRAIDGFPGYLVSSHGHVYSEKRKKIRLKPEASEQGHLRVSLFRDGGPRRGERILVHRLVLSAFSGPPPSNESQGRHLDGNPSNNAVGNLIWGDQVENWKDSKAHGNFRRYSKLTPEQVDQIRARGESGESATSISKDFPVSDTQVRNIIDGKQWAIDPPIGWPLKNCWLGVSTENQEWADKRIPALLATPAAKRFVSYEPALGPVDFRRVQRFKETPKEFIDALTGNFWTDQIGLPNPDPSWDWPGRVPRDDHGEVRNRHLNWIIVGGESGKVARDVEWARSAIRQCKAADVACFVKQMGESVALSTGAKDRKGGDPAEWPADLRVREFPF